jgi:hypothetical protein
MLRSLLVLLFSIFFASISFAQIPLPIKQGGSGSTVGTFGGLLFPAKNYGTCTWSDTGDVGPCINSAISAAHTAGGGTVLIPAGTYGFSTEIVQGYSNVRLQGAGVGQLPYNNSTNMGTRLVWLGTIGQNPAVYIGQTDQNSGTNVASADVVGIAFDGNNRAAMTIEMIQLTGSVLNYGCINATVTCTWHTTTTATSGGSGFQDNTINVWILESQTNSTATGILIDSQGKWTIGNGNVSYNTYNLINSVVQNGDAVVIGYTNANVFNMIRAFKSATANTLGSSVIVGNEGSYTSPNGVSISDYALNNQFTYVSAPVDIQGSTTGATLTLTSNPGSQVSLHNTSLTTSAATTSGSTLTFTSTTPASALHPLGAGQSVNCGGTNSGVYPNSIIQSVTDTTIRLNTNVITGNGSTGIGTNITCNFSFGVTPLAVPGTYIVRFMNPLWQIEVPQNAIAIGLTNQLNIASSNGILKTRYVVIPLAGQAVDGDYFTLVIPVSSKYTSVLGVDKGNGLPNPYCEGGSTGFWINSMNPYTTPCLSNNY